MPINTNLNGFFTQGNIAEVLTKLAKPNSPLRDFLFPESNRKQKASPYIALHEIENATGALPVVMRGAQSYPVNTGKDAVNLFEPAGFRPSDFVSAKDVNNYLAIGNAQGLNALLQEKVEGLRDSITASTEILCAQSLSGTIKYPAVSFGANTDYIVNLGQAKTANNVDIKGKDLGVLQGILEEHYNKQSQTGAYADVWFLAGSDAYSGIVKIILDAKGNTAVQWTDFGMVLFGKYKIKQLGGGYILPGETKTTAIIDPKTIKTVDVTNMGKLFYLALDDFDANLAPMPFFAKQVKSDDPSGYKIIGMSKPLPAFAVSKTVDRKYLA